MTIDVKRFCDNVGLDPVPELVEAIDEVNEVMSKALSMNDERYWQIIGASKNNNELLG